MCQFYNPRLTNQCDEERAEEVHDREGANFCDWFKPRPDAHRPRSEGKTQAAKARLDDFFGGAQISGGNADTARDKLSNLFSDGKKRGK